MFALNVWNTSFGSYVEIKNKNKNNKVKGTGCDEMIILGPNDFIRFVRLFYTVYNPKFDQNLLRIE